MARKALKRAALHAAAGLAALTFAAPAAAQMGAISLAEDVHGGELAVPVNKSQVLRVDRPYSKALIGNPEVADILPLTNQSLYVLGKKTGTTSLTLYDARNTLIAVVDVVVGPDVTTLKRQLSELMPADQVGARISNDSIVLEGIVSSAPAADRAVQLAETYAPGKVVNLLSIGSAQQVMLEVRFSEIKRSVLKQLGISGFLGDNKLTGAIGGGAGITVVAVVLAYRAPRALGEIRPPLIPRIRLEEIVLRASRGLSQPAMLGGAISGWRADSHDLS